MSQAQALLKSTYRLVDSGPPASNYLQAELLAAKLNLKLAASQGEDLGGAQIYGSTTSVSSVIDQADDLVAQGTDAPPADVAAVAGQLRAINAGDVTFMTLPTFNMGDSDIGGDQANLFLGYLGTNAAFLEAPITAAVVVPNTGLVLGSSRGGTYIGSFFAKSLEVRPDVTVRYLSFGP